MTGFHRCSGPFRELRLAYFIKRIPTMSKKIASLLSASALVLAIAVPAGAAGAKAPAKASPTPVAQPAPAAPAPPPEKHPEIRDALAALRNAKAHLEHGAHDFGGHRVDAIRATDEAIRQLEICLQYDKD
jgi:hypothetical protein